MKMKAKMRAIWTTSMDHLDLHTPKDPEHFCIAVRAMVGPEGGKGEESFDIDVCTPKWLEEACQSEGFVVGRHYLIVTKYDVTQLKSVITSLVESCEGDSWREVAEKVSRIGHWEFEDYRHYL
jgi:Immunity protein 8